MGLSKGIDFFFGLGSVAYFVSLSLTELGSSGGGKSSIMSCSVPMLARLLHAQYCCKKEHRQLLPKDLFKLKGFMVAGTDNHCYKDDLEYLWGIRPMELFAGTEQAALEQRPGPGMGCISSRTPVFMNLFRKRKWSGIYPIRLISLKPA